MLIVLLCSIIVIQVLPALQIQEDKLKKQLVKERQECLELEMNIESMLVEVKEPPSLGSSRLVCGHCHHRGHRNSTNKPCELKKCTEYTYCGIKEKHQEYFSKLNSLKVELKKKKTAMNELESQIKSMETFSSGSEYQFVKNLTPRMFAVDASYKTNKAKLMRDVRLLRTFCDGKVPVSTANDAEQLKILIGKSKKQVGISDTNMIELNTENESPIKTKLELKSDIEKSGTSTSENEASCRDSSKNRKSKKRKKHMKQKKAKKRSRENRSSTSSSEDQTRQVNLFQDRNTNYAGVGAFPHFRHHGGGFQLPGYNPIIYQPSPYPPYATASGVHAMNSSSSSNAASGMQTMPLPSNVNVWNYTQSSQFPQVQGEFWQNLDTLAAAATDNVTAERSSPDKITH